MEKIVFIQTSQGPLNLEDVLPSLSAAFQKALREKAQQLSTTGFIDGPQTFQHKNGHWSVWLEDEKGDRHNFQLFLSAIEQHDTVVTPRVETPTRLGVYVARGQGYGEEFVFVEASRYIVENYEGTTRAQLLQALEKAQKRLPAFDPILEWTRTGVILRALKDDQDRSQFQAEVRLEFER